MRTELTGRTLIVVEPMVIGELSPPVGVRVVALDVAARQGEPSDGPLRAFSMQEVQRYGAFKGGAPDLGKDLFVRVSQGALPNATSPGAIQSARA